jgi:hypothetical protein
LSIAHKEIATADNILAQKGINEGKGCEDGFKYTFLWVGGSNKDFKNVAGELALVFHTVKHNISYRSMVCTCKLSKDIVHY